MVIFVLEKFVDGRERAVINGRHEGDTFGHSTFDLVLFSTDKSSLAHCVNDQVLATFIRFFDASLTPPTSLSFFVFLFVIGFIAVF